MLHKEENEERVIDEEQKKIIDDVQKEINRLKYLEKKEEHIEKEKERHHPHPMPPHNKISRSITLKVH